MRRYFVALLVLFVMGCSNASPPPPPPVDPVEPVPPVTAGPDPAPDPAPAPAKPPLQAEHVIALRVGRDGTGTALPPGEHREDLKALAAAYAAAPAPESGAAVPVYWVDLYTGLTQKVTLGVIDADRVMIDNVGITRSTALTEALSPLGQRLLVYRSELPEQASIALDSGWKLSRYGWQNERTGMHLSVHRWKSVTLAPDGRWRLSEWGGVEDPELVAVRGKSADYQGVRYTPVPETTGGGFFGTLPLQVGVAGGAGGVTLSCGHSGSSQDAEQRKAWQAKVDQECPAMLAQFVVDLGAPLTPAPPLVAVPAGQPAVVQDGRLVFAPGAARTWHRADAHVWQFGTWVLDTRTLAIQPAAAPWPDMEVNTAWPVRRADGSVLGLRGGNFVLQAAGKAEQVLGKAPADVRRLAPAGPTALAYMTVADYRNHGAGPLWHLDWASGNTWLVAEAGSPVGLLADGRALAHRGGNGSGELIAWQGSADTVAPLSPAGVRAYGAQVSPAGDRVVYFHATEAVDYPRVDTVAHYDALAQATVARLLPGVGYVMRTLWAPDGSLVFHFSWGQKSATFRLTAAGELQQLTPDTGSGAALGFDGCTLVTAADWTVQRHTPPGCAATPDPLPGNFEQILGRSGLLAVPVGSSTRILDTTTGQWYTGPALSLPYPEPSYFLEWAPISPESGYVALQVQTYPQVIYELLPVKPVR